MISQFLIMIAFQQVPNVMNTSQCYSHTTALRSDIGMSFYPYPGAFWNDAVLEFQLADRGFWHSPYLLFPVDDAAGRRGIADGDCGLTARVLVGGHCVPPCAAADTARCFSQE